MLDELLEALDPDQREVATTLTGPVCGLADALSVDRSSVLAGTALEMGLPTIVERTSVAEISNAELVEVARRLEVRSAAVVPLRPVRDGDFTRAAGEENQDPGGDE
jgi:hypothetical protein